VAQKTVPRKRPKKTARLRASLKKKHRKRQERVSGHKRVKGAKRNSSKSRKK
jgi:hypothetical protein